MKAKKKNVRPFLAPALKKAVKKLKPAIKAAVKKAIDEQGRKVFAEAITAPGYDTPTPGPSWIKPGRYVMRNRSIAVVTGPTTIKFGINHRHTWHGWKGHLEGHELGEGLNWSLDGKRSDAAGSHEHDLIRRHAKQKGKQ